FDARVFAPRQALPPVPRLALAFGNDFSAEHEIPILRAACANRGIELDVAGIGVNAVEVDPGARLARYDVVFAKARSAIEALAVGCGVILCAWGRLGPMVTTSNWESLRKLNFGVRTLSERLAVQTVESRLR